MGSATVENQTTLSSEAPMEVDEEPKNKEQEQQQRDDEDKTRGLQREGPMLLATPAWINEKLKALEERLENLSKTEPIDSLLQRLERQQQQRPKGTS